MYLYQCPRTFKRLGGCSYVVTYIIELILAAPLRGPGPDLAKSHFDRQRSGLTNVPGMPRAALLVEMQLFLRIP